MSPWWRRFGIAVLALLGLSLVPPLIVLALRWVPPPTTAFMLRSEVQPVQYEWVPAARMPEVLRRAVIASEDQKFRTHNGFDLDAIEAALEQNRRGGRVRGASTITQQVAKNLFLWPGRSWLRKGVEVSFTILIELLWSKDRILEVYLNIAEFGPGIYGVEAASAAFFHKPAARLTPNEAARLVAVLPSPRKWKAQPPGPYVQQRANWILAQIGERPRASAPAQEPLPPGGMPADADPDEPDEQPADIFHPPDEDEAWIPPDDDDPAEAPRLGEPMPPEAGEPAEPEDEPPGPQPDEAQPAPEEEPGAPGDEPY